MFFLVVLACVLSFILLCFYIRYKRRYAEHRKHILRHNQGLVAQRRPLTEEEEIDRYHRRLALAQAYQGKEIKFSALGKRRDLYYYGKSAPSPSPSSSYSARSYSSSPPKKKDEGGGLFNLFD